MDPARHGAGNQREINSKLKIVWQRVTMHARGMFFTFRGAPNTAHAHVAGLVTFFLLKCLNFARFILSVRSYVITLK